MAITDPNADLLKNVWDNPINGLGASGYGFAITVLLTVIFGIALLYMTAVAFRHERFKRWLLGELLQAFASAMMIVGLVAIAYFLSSASLAILQAQSIGIHDNYAGWGIDANAFNNQAQAGPLAYLQAKLGILDIQMDTLYQDTVKTDMRVERAEWTCIIFFGMEIKCGWDLHPKTEALHALAYKLVELRVAINAMLVMVQYIGTNFLTVFLPIGIVLRAFPFTRGAGGLIIALVLGFYFVFPVLYALGDMSLDANLQRPDSTFLNSPLANQCIFSDSSLALNAQAMDAGAVAGADGFISHTSGLLATLTIQAILVPLLSLAGTVFFIRAISPLLGSESQDMVYGMSKML
jgi:hypothetical protein